MTDRPPIRFEEQTRVPQSGVAEVLALAMGHPTPTRVRETLQCYERSTAWRLLMLLEGEAGVGLVGIELLRPQSFRIRHLAVRPSNQRLGLGRALLNEARTRFSASHLYAETDSDAVDFYRACGFSIMSLGEQPHGLARFACTWTAPGDLGR